MNTRTKRMMRALGQLLILLSLLFLLIFPVLLSMYYYFVEKDVLRAIFWLLLGYFNWKLRSE